MSELGEALQNWRLEHKRTLKEQADVWGVSWQFVQQLEAGEKPMPPWMLDKLPNSFYEPWAQDVAARRMEASRRKRSA